MIKEIVGEEQFRELIEGNRYVVVDIGSDFCEPCRELAPIFDAMEKFIEDAVFVSVDWSKEENAGIVAGIDAIPMVYLYRDGKLVRKIRGLQTYKYYEAVITRDFDFKATQDQIVKDAGENAFNIFCWGAMCLIASFILLPIPFYFYLNGNYSGAGIDGVQLAFASSVIVFTAAMLTIWSRYHYAIWNAKRDMHRLGRLWLDGCGVRTCHQVINSASFFLMFYEAIVGALSIGIVYIMYEIYKWSTSYTIVAGSGVVLIIFVILGHWAIQEFKNSVSELCECLLCRGGYYD